MIYVSLRAAELKHGRVCMLGVVGQLVQSVYRYSVFYKIDKIFFSVFFLRNDRFPGYIDLEGHKFSDYENGQAGIFDIPPLGLAQIILSIGWWDLKGWKQVPGSTPGDFGIPYLDGYKTEEQKADIRAKELNNGRAAQMGLLAMLVHEGLDGKPFIFF